MSTGRYGGRRGPWPIAAFALAAVAIFAVGIIVSSVWHPVVVSGPYPFFPFGVFWVWPLFAFVFIFFVARWFFWGWGWRGGYGRYNDATGILQERYAKGEITKEQFEQMKKDLEQGTR
jgi:putative membrane protein